VFIAPLSHTGPYSLVAACGLCWIIAHVSTMAAKVPKKFSTSKNLRKLLEKVLRMTKNHSH